MLLYSGCYLCGSLLWQFHFLLKWHWCVQSPVFVRLQCTDLAFNLAGLNFGKKFHVVANCALRLVASMKRDWMQVWHSLTKMWCHVCLLEKWWHSVSLCDSVWDAVSVLLWDSIVALKIVGLLNTYWSMRFHILELGISIMCIFPCKSADIRTQSTTE